MAIIDNTLLGQYEASLTAQSNMDRIATDKNTFLKLLVAQLTHQDPLNPVEDKEFIAQLAQFTNVEELQNLNKGMQTLNESYLRQQATNAANLIGMQVAAKGDNVSIANIGSTDPDRKPSSSWIYATFPSQTAGGLFNVYSTNSDGSIGRLVYSSAMGPQAEGTRGFQWEGRDGSNNPLPDGTYIVNITAVDANGKNILVSTSSIGLVVGVETQTSGNHKLMLADGRTVLFNDVEIVTSPEFIQQDSGEGGAQDAGSGDELGQPAPDAPGGNEAADEEDDAAQAA